MVGNIFCEHSTWGQRWEPNSKSSLSLNFWRKMSQPFLDSSSNECPELPVGAFTSLHYSLYSLPVIIYFILFLFIPYTFYNNFLRLQPTLLLRPRSSHDEDVLVNGMPCSTFDIIPISNYPSFSFENKWYNHSLEDKYEGRHHHRTVGF